MAKKKSIEQALMWLQNKIAEKDTLDSINAGVCRSVILDLQRENERIGAVYHSTKVKYENAKEQLERIGVE